MKNGSSSTGSISSAKRVRITIALNRVPTATNPTVARAITATSGARARHTGTSKNSTKRGRATHSTTATNIRLATSLPRYRLVRLMGDTSSASKASFSSSSWNARFRARIAAKLNVTHRMLGARSIVATAVGSRPKLNSVNTSAVNTTADSTAVRVRNSRSRSLRAIVQAWRRVSATSGPPRSSRPNGAPVGFRDLGRLVRPAWREMHEAPAPLERHVGGQFGPFVHVVRGEHDHPAGATKLGEQGANLRCRREVEPRERLGEEEPLRVVHQRPGDRGPLRQPAGEGPDPPVGLVRDRETAHHLRGAGPPPSGGDVVQRRPEHEILRHREVSVEMTLVPDPADGPAPPGHGSASRLRPDQTRKHLQERRLSRPIGTEDDERSPGRETERDVIQRDHMPKGVPEPVSSEHRAVLWRPHGGAISCEREVKRRREKKT